MREYQLDDADQVVRDYLESRRRREQPASMTGKLEHWSPDDDESPDGSYEHLAGLVRDISVDHMRILELWYYGSVGPRISSKRLAWENNAAVVDDLVAESPTARQLAEHLTTEGYLGRKWTESDVKEVRRRAVHMVGSRLLVRIVRPVDE